MLSMQEPGECLVFFNFRDDLDNQQNVLEELRRAEAMIGQLLGMLLEVVLDREDAFRRQLLDLRLSVVIPEDTYIC